MDEAADEIERLREALKKVQSECDGCGAWAVAEDALKGGEDE